MTSATDRSSDPSDFMNQDDFAERGYPWAAWDRLRAEEPVSRQHHAGVDYWAITRYDDITSISRQPELFQNGKGLVLAAPATLMENRPRNILETDPPEHLPARRLISPRLTPRALKKIKPDVDRIAKQIVDDLLEGDLDSDGTRTCDFVDEVSAPLPIAVIAWMLGVPESDWRKLYDWTNQLVGFDDPEFYEGDLSRMEEIRNETRAQVGEYFSELIAKRRAEPKDDLISLFTHAEIEGKKLDMIEILTWCEFIVAAGNETTRNATSGGLLAFIENPAELARLQGDVDGLLKPAVEEVLRYSSPVIHMTRAANDDSEVGGVKIAKDDFLVLFYPSGNRDASVFEDPYAFRIDRPRNRHLAFGVGEHFCAGAHVARLEIEMAYRYLLPRIESIELAGPVDRLRSNFIGGIKRLPVRYKLKDA